MRRLLAHLAEVVQRGDDATAEVMMPDSVDNHARGQRIVSRCQPFRQRPAAARGVTVGRRQLRRWIAVGNHADESRLRYGSAALEISVEQKICRRRLIPAGSLMEKGSRDRFLLDAFARLGLVAGTIG